MPRLAFRSFIIVATFMILVLSMYGSKADAAQSPPTSLTSQERGVPMSTASSVSVLSEEKPGPNDVGFLPREGSTVGTTPPSFAWLPIRGAKEYVLEVSVDPAFPDSTTQKFTGIELSIYTPSTAMATGTTYFWRYMYVDSNGVLSAPSPSRSFYISEQAVHFPLPELPELHERLPKAHPRLLVRPETADALRATRTTTRGRLAYQSVVRPVTFELLAKQNQPLPAEPGNPYITGTFDADVWSAGMRLCRSEFDGLQQLAFDYLLTGAEDVAAEAKRRLLHFMSWDPKGNTSAKINDECSMPMLWGVSRAYTWLYDTFTPDERQLVQQVMRVRGEEAYQLMRALPFERNPYDSHLGRTLGFLGETAIAFYDEIPEAEKWFDYIIQVFFALYPAWGGDDGGWAEGTSYWKHYMTYVAEFVDALSVATDIDLTAKPFFQNTGYFKLYTHSLGTGTPFGDGLGEGVTEADAQIMDWLGRRTGNGHFRWYAAVAPGSQFRRGLYGYLALIEEGAPQQAVPADLPPSQLFTDVGWVAMHTHLTEPKNDIRLVFKSSPYGSYSHSHADQNAFVIDAFGSPLAIPTGYYDWYMSPHHRNFTQETVSKNTILVDSRGQLARSLEAKGHIAEFFASPSYDYTMGDAARAYPGDLLRYDRHILFLRPHVFVMFDALEAPRPVQFSWLLHAWNEMSIDAPQQSVQIINGGAKLDVNFLSPQGLTLSQTDESLPKVSIDGLRSQWHLQANTGDPAEQMQFVTVLAPARHNVKPADGELANMITSEALPFSGGSGVHVAYALGDGSVWDHVVAFRHPESDVIQGERLAGDAAVMAYGTHVDAAGTLLARQALLIGGTELVVDGVQIVRTSHSANVSATWQAESLALTVDQHAPADLTISVVAAQRPTKVNVNGILLDEWTYADGHVTLNLEQ